MSDRDGKTPIKNPGEPITAQEHVAALEAKRARLTTMLAIQKMRRRFAERRVREMVEILNERNTPRKYVVVGRTTFCLYGTSSISAYDRLKSELDQVVAERDQEHDIRTDRETIIQHIAELVSVADEPHQTFWERLVARVEELIKK